MNRISLYYPFLFLQSIKNSLAQNRRSILLVLIFLFLLHSHTLTFSQRVGIGTEFPTETLDVVGNIRVDSAKLNAFIMSTNAGAGKLMTSDASGNASWQMPSTPPPLENNGNIGYGVWGDCATNGNISGYQPASDTSLGTYSYLGRNVSISGNFAIAGASDDDEGFTDQGSAIVYLFDGTQWVFLQKLLDPDPGEEDLFGSSVFISGTWAFVGAPNDDDNVADQGAVHVFQFNGSSWVFMQKLVDPTGGTSYAFGSSVTMSGDFMAIGSPMDDSYSNDQGSVTIFQLTGGTWEWNAKLYDSQGASGDRFGGCVAMDGNHLFAGAYCDVVNGNVCQGSALAFRYDGNAWVFVQKITIFGNAFDLFGASISVDENLAVIGASGYNQGKGIASLYRYSGTNWTSVRTFSNDTQQNNDAFGFSLCISGNYLLIGVQGGDMAPFIDCGYAVLYQKIGNGWQKIQQVADPGRTYYDEFGVSLSIDHANKRFIGGARGFAGYIGKVIFGKVN